MSSGESTDVAVMKRLIGPKVRVQLGWAVALDETLPRLSLERGKSHSSWLKEVLCESGTNGCEKVSHRYDNW